MNRRIVAWILGAAVAATAVTPAALALINPKRTVVHLVRDSGSIVLVKVSPQKDGKATAEVVETISGEKPSAKSFTLDFTDAKELPDKTFDDAQKSSEGLAVMCFFKRAKDGVKVGALEMGCTWLGLEDAGEGTWKLDRDPFELETVWGGSAKRLVPAIRYTLNDPAADFPVASMLAWEKDASLGALGGAAHDIRIVDLGGSTGVCAVVACDAGDRVYQVRKGAAPADISKSLALATKSRAVAFGDFNGDGKLDVVSWDGKKVAVSLRNADGTFAAPAAGADLADCRSLHTVSGGVLAAASDGVVSFGIDGKGALAARKLAAPANLSALGPGGGCAVGDFDGDGVADVAQLFAKGIVFYAGTAKPGEFAPPVVTEIAVGKCPTLALCADFDADGNLDILAAGEGGTSLFARTGKGVWESMMDQTGELAAASGLGQGETTAVAASLLDINGDSRQGLAVFSAASGPGLFFNRGFACFGIARTMVFGESRLKAAEAIGGGTTCGAVWDLDGDGAPDVLAADAGNALWAVYTKTMRPRPKTIVLTSAATGPLTVHVLQADRLLGAYVVRPGEPVSVSSPKEGVAVTLRYHSAGGKLVTKAAEPGAVLLD